MGRFLNVGIIQMPLSEDTAENLRYLAQKAEALMGGYHRPELVVGVEGGIGFNTPQPIPGPITEYLSKIARKHAVYFIPGTMWESHAGLGEGQFYNSAPVFNPRGELIAVYRKMAPWRPFESRSAPGREYVVFDIPEKDTKIGVQICYDLNFPEISRNETLLGAEVLIKLTEDPEELYLFNKPLHYTRALENQAYLVSTNGAGYFANFAVYGNSLVISPEGKLLWEAGQVETIATVTLDLDLVKRCRDYGTGFLDHYLKHLGQYNFPQPFAGKIGSAPVYHMLSPAPDDIEAYDTKAREMGFGSLAKRYENDNEDESMEQYRKSLQEFLDKQ